jgi:hypothetical protein
MRQESSNASPKAARAPLHVDLIYTPENRGFDCPFNGLCGAQARRSRTGRSQYVEDFDTTA